MNACRYYDMSASKLPSPKSYKPRNIRLTIDLRDIGLYFGFTSEEDILNIPILFLVIYRYQCSQLFVQSVVQFLTTAHQRTPLVFKPSN